MSICIPVYNAEKTIKKTIDSAIMQTYKNIEITIIDNGSTDCTVDIIKRIKDHRVRFYQNEKNLGMVGNWNKCLTKASGVYIHFLCADDFIKPDCIEKKMQMFQQHSEIVLVTSSTEIIDENDNLLMERKRFKKDVVVNGKRFAKKSYYIANLYGEPSNVMFLSKVVEKAGKFSLNTIYATDWDFWLRISAYGNVGCLKESLTQYRISISNETSSIKFSDFLKDDRIMTKNILDNRCIKINKFDVAIHRFMYIFRMFARSAYMKIKNR